MELKDPNRHHTGFNNNNSSAIPNDEFDETLPKECFIKGGAFCEWSHLYAGVADRIIAYCNDQYGGSHGVLGCGCEGQQLDSEGFTNS